MIIISLHSQKKRRKGKSQVIKSEEKLEFSEKETKKKKEGYIIDDLLLPSLHGFFSLTLYWHGVSKCETLGNNILAFP